MQTYEMYRDMVADTTRWQSQYQHYDTQYMSNYLSIPGLNEFHSYNGVEFMRDAAAWRKSSGLGGFTTLASVMSTSPAKPAMRAIPCQVPFTTRCSALAAVPSRPAPLLPYPNPRFRRVQ